MSGQLGTLPQEGFSSNFGTLGVIVWFGRLDLFFLMHVVVVVVTDHSCSHQYSVILHKPLLAFARS